MDQKAKKIVLYGIETNNKGAELMLYAILQEVERRFPDATVYLPLGAIKQKEGLKYLHTHVDVKYKPGHALLKLARKFHVAGLLKTVGLNPYWAEDVYTIKGADYLLDASGFRYSDQWKIGDYAVNFMEASLRGYFRQGTKIVFMPQAFGPFTKPGTRDIMAVINRYASLVMPREKVSYDYFKTIDFEMGKVHQFTDFTSLVDGVFPERYRDLEGGICIIPSNKMFSKKVVSFEDYVHFILQIVAVAEVTGRPVYLLNHEGGKDEKLVKQIAERLNHGIQVVTQLNGLEVKGLISSAYLCITSRFHGAASALNSSVPCLATSWSHKYAELFKDYDLHDNLLDIQDMDSCMGKVEELLNTEKNEAMHQHLLAEVDKIKAETRSMWDLIFNN